MHLRPTRIEVNNNNNTRFICILFNVNDKANIFQRNLKVSVNVCVLYTANPSLFTFFNDTLKHSKIFSPKYNVD